jgi:hypothetical protein
MRKCKRLKFDDAVDVCGICGCLKLSRLPYCNQCGFGRSFYEATHQGNKHETTGGDK